MKSAFYYSVQRHICHTGILYVTDKHQWEWRNDCICWIHLSFQQMQSPTCLYKPATKHYLYKCPSWSAALSKCLKLVRLKPHLTARNNYQQLLCKKMAWDRKYFNIISKYKIFPSSLGACILSVGNHCPTTKEEAVHLSTSRQAIRSLIQPQSTYQQADLT